MSKNISNLSGRIGLKDNLFKKMSENVLNDSPKDIKDIEGTQKIFDHRANMCSLASMGKWFEEVDKI